jgi:hypothetical protein
MISVKFLHSKNKKLLIRAESLSHWGRPLTFFFGPTDEVKALSYS